MSNELRSSVATEGPGLRAASTVAKDLGVSRVTLWRFIRRGWLESVNIAGRLYLPDASLMAFLDRAKRGEFSRPPRGAAAARPETVEEPM